MDRLTGIFSGAAKVLMLILSALGVFAILTLLIMASQGMFQKDRLKLAVRAMKGDKLEKVVVKEMVPDQKLAELEEEKKKREMSFQKKQQDLENMERLLQELQRDVQAKQEKLNAERLELEKLRKRENEAGSQLAAEQTDVSFKANVEMFSKMDPEDIVKILKTWEDGKIRSMLRALKPAAAAEVVTLLSADKDFNVLEPDKKVLGIDKKDSDKKWRINRILQE